MELAAPCWPHLPAAPQVTRGLSPQLCPRQPQEPAGLLLLLPKAGASLHQ